MGSCPGDKKLKGGYRPGNEKLGFQKAVSRQSKCTITLSPSNSAGSQPDTLRRYIPVFERASRTAPGNFMHREKILATANGKLQFIEHLPCTPIFQSKTHTACTHRHGIWTHVGMNTCQSPCTPVLLTVSNGGPYHCLIRQIWRCIE